MLILNLSNQLRRFPAAPHFCSTRRCPIAAVGPAAPFVRLQWLWLQPLWLWLWLCELGHCVSLSWVTELLNGWVLIWLLDWQTPVVPEVRFSYQVKRRLSSFVFWVGSWGTRKSQDLKQGCSWVVLGVFCCSPFVSNGTEICERIMKWHVTRAVARAFASVKVERCWKSRGAPQADWLTATTPLQSMVSTTAAPPQGWDQDCPSWHCETLNRPIFNLTEILPLEKFETTRLDIAS